ncbi:MAG: long-chain fatty acid--CoA ligase [Bradymonadales bacterium]|nr:long-chain fatty acid--CoA ligase [Bradymonadales bacterium]
MTYEYEKPDNLVDLFESAVARFPENPLFGTKGPDGRYQWLTYKQVGEQVDAMRSALAGMGIGREDFVGIIANNRVEWVVAAFATYGLGARFVPMYEAELEKTWRYIIQHSEIKLLLVSKPEILEKVEAFRAEIPTLEHLVHIDGEGPHSLRELLEQGRQNTVPSVHPAAEEIAVLIYTSGTTQQPKGVLLTHGNLTSNSRAGYTLYPELNEEAVFLSILPWAHSYALTAEMNNNFQFGGSIGIMGSLDTLAQDFLQVRPTYLIAVPRVFHRIYEGVWAKMNQTGGLPRKLFLAAVETAQKRRQLAEQGKTSIANRLKFAVLDRLVFSKIRARFGGRLRMALTASATMNPEMSHFFSDIGIPVFDCYGLTETSPAVTMNSRAAHKVGSVGKPVRQVRVEIDRSLVEGQGDDGEIVVYGPNVMAGYHKDPDATRAVMTEDGGFRTGDRGRLDEEGFLYITGRIKEQYKLANGKYVFPASVEEEIALLPHVASAMVYGEGRPYNICLVVPDFAALSDFIQLHDLPRDPDALVQNEQIQKLILQEIRTALQEKYASYEIPKKIMLLPEDFTLSNDMMTQTMKLKRRVIKAKFHQQIDGLYEE